jgi:Protein of unknown function (DUF1200).
MVFKPKRDLWLSIIMWCCIALLFFSALSPFVIGGAGPFVTFFVLVLCLPCAAFILWIWLKVSYVIGESDLVVRMGPIRIAIPLASIRKIKPVRSIVSSTATSINRLEIHYKAYDMIYISPLLQEAFIAELQRRCPQLKLE